METDEDTPAGRRWLVLEGLVAFGVAILFAAASLLIRVNPMNRLGQVSGLANLALRFTVIGIALVAALIIAQRVRGGRGFETTWRLVCAGVAGLATGMLAGGILVALRGTFWGLYAPNGDAAALCRWAEALQRGDAVPAQYPPLPIHVLAWYSSLFDLPPEHALKHLQAIGTAAFGPVSYLAWRMVLRPGWALAIGVLAILPIIDPYKPYTNLVLAVFFPLSIRFLGELRDAGGRHPYELARVGVIFGLAYGLLCLGYSGWFQWTIPGLFVAGLVLFPWRTGWRSGATLVGVTAAMFLVLTWRYVAAMETELVDKFVYFDARTEPMYVAMFRNDLPGANLGPWPPPGELGGVGLFTVLLAIGLGAAIAVGRRSTLVIGGVAVMAGAWLFRFFYARQMWESKLVQLYPRTTQLLLYILLVLTVYAALRLGRRVVTAERLAWARIGALCTLLVIAASAASATADRYMPSDAKPLGAGILAWNAQQAQRATRAKVPKPTPRKWVRRSL